MKQKIFSLAILFSFTSLVFCLALMPIQTVKAEEKAVFPCHAPVNENSIPDMTCCEGAQDVLFQDAYFTETEVDIVLPPYASNKYRQYFVRTYFQNSSLLSDSDPPPDFVDSLLTHKKTVVLIR